MTLVGSGWRLVGGGVALSRTQGPLLRLPWIGLAVERGPLHPAGGGADCQVGAGAPPLLPGEGRQPHLGPEGALHHPLPLLPWLLGPSCGGASGGLRAERDNVSCSVDPSWVSHRTALCWILTSPTELL